MVFRLGGGSGAVADTPEQFYNELRSKRIPGLLSHQADILREYTRDALTAPDVALQLPTGSGKTLVGLVLAEWRRKKYGERVVYLCPTNQLVRQAAAQSASRYGIPLRTFTGSAADYDRGDRSAYRNAEAIAVTSYSALFNTNPFFSDANIIILDDAHSADNYIAGFWSLRLDRFNERHQGPFAAIVSLLRPHISHVDHARLIGAEDDPWSQAWVEMIPAPTLDAIAPKLVELLDEHVRETDLSYPWSVLRDHLDACAFYYGAREILIRPIIAPTGSHPAFVNAKQRVYMSATLGKGGELERITGRASIVRLSIPTGWDSQGTGRRLFLFPERAESSADPQQLTGDVIRRASRVLYLVPSGTKADSVANWVTGTLSFTRFDARELEHDKQRFVTSHQAVAVVANRYDGIDLPDDECRLVVLHGLPSAVSLQERFLVRRLGAAALLDDRVRTRVVQGVGRATRSPTDYAAIIILGDELSDYLMRAEGRVYLHPDVRAEIEFGIDQSRDSSPADFFAMFDALLQQDQNWLNADADILRRRREMEAADPPGTIELAAAAPHEVGYQLAVWNGNHLEALAHARAALAALSHPALRGYRALWLYLAGAAALRAASRGSAGLEAEARSFFRQAHGSIPAVRWLSALGRPGSVTEYDSPQQRDSRLAIVIERLELQLERFGMSNDRRFNREEADILAGLAAREKERFEPAHERLGRLLGYDADNRETRAAPDPWWMVDDTLGFVFEDHSNAEAESVFSVAKARQAASHPQWMRANVPEAATAEIRSVIVTSVTKVEREAAAFLTEVGFWAIDDFRQWAYRAVAVIRNLRESFPGAGYEAWRAHAAELYVENRMDPASVLARIKANPASQSMTLIG